MKKQILISAVIALTGITQTVHAGGGAHGDGMICPTPEHCLTLAEAGLKIESDSLKAALSAAQVHEISEVLKKHWPVDPHSRRSIKTDPGRPKENFCASDDNRPRQTSRKIRQEIYRRH